jgi:ubiquitin-conjugating enzyme E2 J2
MATDICVRRLKRELTALKKDPILEPRISVTPNESNILEMHYVIEGSRGTPYEGGVYHGKLIFPKEYPLKPPSVLMLTPSGRFHPNRRLCLSMSDFHPESWNPMWSVSTILTGLYSFMLDTNIPTLGSMETTDAQKRQLAKDSLAYNCKHTTVFGKLFPEYLERYQQQLLEEEERNKTSHRSKYDNGEDEAITIPVPSELLLPQGLFMAMVAGLVAVFSIVVAIRFL